MNIQTFKTSFDQDAPPEGLPNALQALWRLEKGDWPEAHRLAQAQDDKTGAWVHAHLHRVEGDLPNARYWYRRADRPESTAPLKEEWEEIALALLD
jgi:hypothetical protein